MRFQIIDIIKKVFIIYITYIAYSYYLKISNNRQWWVREINETRETHGFFIQLFKIVQDRDHDQFEKATRMSVEHFQILLNLLEKKLTKRSIRKSIDPECRLALTLIYLAHGCPFQVLAWSFKVGVSTAREIVLETCQLIWDELSTIYLAPPSVNEYKNIAQSFWSKWQMPNCVGAIDGKHVNIVCPPRSGSLYYNYKGHHSIVLLAACDANYCFTAVDIGAFGSQSDGGVFASSSFGKLLLSGQLPLPKNEKLPNSDVIFPFYFVGDAAFPLKKYLMRPYPGRNLCPEREYFNKRLSRARRLIENTFGIMSNRWRILTTTIHSNPENVKKMVMAIVVLHNFLMSNKNEKYCSYSFVDHVENGEMVAGQWREEGVNLQSCRPFMATNASRDSFSLREILKKYLNDNKF